MVCGVAILVSSLVTVAVAQFGGGYTPPAPICQAFKCPKGEAAVGKPDTKIISYGCKDSGLNVFNMASFDPNNPTAGLNKGPNLNKCCVERDICKQTCGMTSKDCHEAFQKCQAKICKGDQNCQLQAMISDMSNDPYDVEKYDYSSEKYNAEEAKCRGYKNAQAEVCQCVPKEAAREAHTSKLKSFYSKFNPEKLDDKGEIKDADKVWKMWKGKEKDMFVALATKYKEKVVEIREKPKPPPYTPPKKDADGEDSGSADAADDPPSAPPVETADPKDVAFDAKLKELTEKKERAKQDEDFDLAAEVKEKISALKAAEVERLKGKKDEAIGVEDYVAAKKIKARIAKIEL